MLTSETLQIFVLLSDLSKIPDVRILYSLKKGLNWKPPPLRIPLRGNFPLGGNWDCILFLSSQQIGSF